MRRHPRSALVALVVPALLAAACSDDSEEPAASISSQVARAVAQQLDLPAGEVTAACPAEAEAAAGAAFVCDVVVDDQAVQASVAFTSDDVFGVELAAEVLSKEQIESDVRAELARRFVGIDVAKVDCGGEERVVVVVAAGETVECHAEDTVGGKAVATVGLNAEGRAVVQSVSDPTHPVPGEGS